MLIFVIFKVFPEHSYVYIMKKKIKAFPKNFFEKKAWEQNLQVCGIDEVGRGCLAGPVVVAAAIIPPGCTYHLLKDSKVLVKEERERAYKWIVKHCLYSVAYACHKTIDEHNIYQATRIAMKKAYISLVEQLPFSLEELNYVLVDAVPLSFEKSYTHPNLEVRHFNYGETVSTSIAAASIIAKVTRDRLMEEIDSLFPLYTLKQHKGYATKAHTAALQKNGTSLLHRLSFLSSLTKKNDENVHQQSLFE